MIATTALTDSLRQHPELAELTPQQIERLAEIARDVRFDAGDIIFQEGDGRDDFYLIASGLVALEIRAGNRVIRVETLREGEELGWSAALPDSRRHFQARALRTVHAIAFDGDSLRALCDEDPSFGYRFFRWMVTVVAERLQATQMQIIDLHATS
ncbi:MAG: cyclic nucleotide-binding domain-containing protein [Acidobacteria bacterium]|nr:cyclic nucleotide-binding domain-containing protein [Acidobacteriota bacterium]